MLLIADPRRQVTRSTSVRPFWSADQSAVLATTSAALPRVKGTSHLILEGAGLWACVWVDWFGGFCSELPELFKGSLRQGVGSIRQVVTLVS